MKTNESSDTNCRHASYERKNKGDLKGKLENHVMRGQCTGSNCEEDTLMWLLARDVRAESESEITAAQGQALQTKYRATKYHKQTRLYRIISACTVLAQ
jgi:hypothetical protein